MNDRVA